MILPVTEEFNICITWNPCCECTWFTDSTKQCGSKPVSRRACTT
jgi:hypothetical protein